MKIGFVTSNKAKLGWANRRLRSANIKLIQKNIQIEESRSIAVEDVVLDKAISAEKEIKEPVIIEDTGFYIKSLNNFPATHIKFALKTIGIKGILKLMKGKENKEATFKSALIYSNDDKKRIFVCNDIGTLSNVPRGNKLHGFNELFKIFIPKGFRKTLAEMSDPEFKDYEAAIEKKDHYFKFAEWFVKMKKRKRMR